MRSSSCCSGASPPRNSCRSSLRDSRPWAAEPEPWPLTWEREKQDQSAGDSDRPASSVRVRACTGDRKRGLWDHSLVVQTVPLPFTRPVSLQKLLNLSEVKWRSLFVNKGKQNQLTRLFGRKTRRRYAKLGYRDLPGEAVVRSALQRWGCEFESWSGD